MIKEENFQPNDFNTDAINLAATDYENVLQAAQAYTRAGICVTPLIGKSPTLKEWQDRRLEEEELSFEFLSNRNVGALLGDPSNGLIDVDLDQHQAVRAANLLLPETLTYGREKNPSSHRLFVCDPIPKYKKYSLPQCIARHLGLGSLKKTVTLVELRGTGHQSVFPPSIHPQDQDKYMWEGGEIHEMNGQELEECVREVATATLLALCCTQGIRQDFFLAAAGYLGRYLDRERVEAILEATAAAAGDEEHEKRAQAVLNTLEKQKEGEPTTGGPTLENLAPGVPDLLAKWWGWRSWGNRSGKNPEKTYSRRTT
jgi:putative DNA primase/helicase